MLKGITPRPSIPTKDIRSISDALELAVEVERVCDPFFTKLAWSMTPPPEAGERGMLLLRALRCCIEEIRELRRQNAARAALAKARGEKQNV